MCWASRSISVAAELVGLASRVPSKRPWRAPKGVAWGHRCVLVDMPPAVGNLVSATEKPRQRGQL